MPKKGWWDGFPKEIAHQKNKMRELLRHCSDENEGLMIEEAIRILERAEHKSRMSGDYSWVLAGIKYCADRFG